MLKLKNKNKLIAYNPTEELLNKDFMGKVILECLINNDPEGVMEAVELYLKTVNKVQSVQSVSLPRSTLYSSLKTKNPTIKTLAKIIHSTTLGVSK